MVNPMQGLEDLPLVERHQIPLHFLHIKEDGTSALRIMRMPNPNTLFDLEQLAQYMLIFSRPGMENTWQGIAVDYAYRMHWCTLFGFALCWALCTNSAEKTTLVCYLVLVMAWPELYCKVVDTFNKVYKKPFKGQREAQLSIFKVHIADDQFHHPTMSLDIFQEVDNERLECLKVYGTPAAILQWDGWHKMSKEDYYCLLFEHAKEGAAGMFPEAIGLYYYIGMDLNVGQLWKRTPARYDAFYWGCD
ncbi:hypothetical protein C0993_005323 [Termitomyces sp. T159_Od127]|nr:hypothetical protein C0993_005323 [Termitomyces sp. T159_Od127]